MIFRVVSSVVLTCILIAVLLMGVTELPPFGAVDAPAHNEVMTLYNEKSLEDIGSFNVVTAIILDYRGFDTLIEATVLFTAAILIIVSLRITGAKEDEEFDT